VEKMSVSVHLVKECGEVGGLSQCCRIGSVVGVWSVRGQVFEIGVLVGVSSLLFVFVVWLDCG
jgi:hypothetical protein